MRIMLVMLFIGFIGVRSAWAVVGGASLDERKLQSLKPVLQLKVNRLLCSGTLVGEGKILTASHCLIFADLADRQPQICIADDGGHDLGCLAATDYSVSMPTAMRIQPVFYNNKVYLIRDPDLALVRISPSSANFGKIGAMPAANIAATDDSIAQKSNLMMVGEGCTDYKTMAGAGELRFGFVNLLTEKTDEFHFYSTYTQGGSGASACTGDSGGPLLRIDDDGNSIVYGVISQEGVFQSDGPIMSVYAGLFQQSVKQWLVGQ